MGRKEYANPVFVLGFKHDPKYDTALHAIAQGSNPGIVNAIDQLTVYGAIHANPVAWTGTIEKIHDELGTEIPFYPKGRDLPSCCRRIGRGTLRRQVVPEHSNSVRVLVDTGACSPVFKRSDEVFRLPAPYFRSLSSLFAEPDGGVRK
jgi:hypothetical protein